MADVNIDTKRLKFLADNLNDAIIHIAIREQKNVVQMYARSSDWVESSVGEKFVLDDLRMLIDQAITQAESKK